MTHYNFESVRQSVESGLRETGLPSLAAGMAVDGEIVWESAWGWADRENRVAATVHTPYSLASISKPITATALMVLVERGLLDLDSPANDYLGEAKLAMLDVDPEADPAEATVRRILNHTSGLPLHYQFFYADEPYTRPTMDETIRRYGKLMRRPGERIQYSNLGYGILDYLISRLSKKSYKDFMREEVFIPLGMHRSAVDLTPELDAFQAVRYGNDGVRYPFYDFDHPGGSAVYASVHDLLRFGIHHTHHLMPDQRAILTPESIEDMQAIVSASGVTPEHGVGWNITDIGGIKKISHSGGMGGVSTNLIVIPERKLVVAALCNGAGGLAAQITAQLLMLAAPELAEASAAANTAREAERTAKRAAQSPFTPEEELIGIWDGCIETYNGALPLTITFHETGEVHLKLANQLTALVNEVKYREGEFKGIFVGDIGTEDAARRPYRLHLDMKKRGDIMNGCVIALTHIEKGEGGGPGRRTGNALSYWAEVRKTN